MSLFLQGIAWIFAPSHWVSTANTPSIGVRLGETLYYSAISLLVALIIAIPIGLLIGHTGKGRSAAILVGNVARALPTLGLLSILILLLGIGLLPPVIVFVLLAIPPLLAGAYSGVESVDRQVIDAARAVGMTELQILFKVEIPLSAALLIGGLRAASLQVIATVIVASYFSLDSLGTYIISGISSADYVQMIAGSLLVTALALVVDGLLALVQRFVIPRGVSLGARTNRSQQHATRQLGAAHR
ncbi:MAG: transporter permease [Microbacteriaceae bacterium]|jgi:osmoprotectant transport system permease protein|nr:transporter permease [Microbacteriaceae bacterium]